MDLGESIREKMEMIRELSQIEKVMNFERNGNQAGNDLQVN